jgi:hypothetical protein
MQLSLVKVHFQAKQSNRLKFGDDVGQSLGENHTNRRGIEQNLSGSLLYASFCWHVQTEDSPKHTRCNNH